MRSSIKTNPSIKNNTILPDNYEVFHKDKPKYKEQHNTTRQL